jgi:DnaA family protein
MSSTSTPAAPAVSAAPTLAAAAVEPAAPGLGDGRVAAPLTRQVPLALAPEPAWRLDNFLPGDNSAWPQVSDALRSPNPGVPVYLWGPPGAGKSHLLRAAAALAQARGQRVAAFGPEQSPPWQPWEQSDDIALLLFDDCQSYDAAQQHAAFAAFIEATSLGVAVLAAGSVPPVDLPLRDDLRTRLAWGLVYQLMPPTEAQVRALLRREADRRGILLTDDVMDYLLKRCARDLSHLMRLLDRLDGYSLAAKRSVSVLLLRQMLAEDGLLPAAASGVAA